MPDIMHRLKIAAPAARVYEALTTTDGVRRWWTQDAVLDARPDGTGTFGFYDRRFVITVRVDALAPPQRVVWETVSAAPAWDGTTIAFELTPDGESTTLAFAHRGFAKTDENYASATTRWGFYLVSLKRFLETGTGTPHPDDLDF